MQLSQVELKTQLAQRETEIAKLQRELEIEAALEKVRAKSMTMQKSEELGEVSLLLDEQVRSLGIETRGCAFNIYGENESTEWFSSEIGTLPVYKTPRENVFLEYYEAGQKGKSLVIKEFYGQECSNHYEYLCTIPVMGDALKQMIANGGSFPKQQIDHVAFMKYGYLLFITLQPAPDAHEIFKRFAKVFEQTYTRFLDLQKAEAQVREAQIEASLERVRSRSLAMHNTSELQEVIHTVHTELLHLDISIAGGSFIAINSDIKTTLRCWGAGGTADTTEEINIPLYKKPFCTNLINKIKKGPGFFTEEFTQKEKKDFFTFLFNHDPWQQLNAEQKKETLSSPGGYTRSCFVSKHSSIFIINHFGEIFSADDNNILQRFGKVFEQAYTRFLDLQKAESQTRESQINLAVERVRATAMAMHQTTDLDEVNKEILHQLNLLQVPGLSGVTFYLLDELGWVKAWDFSSPGNIGEQNSYTLHFDSNRHEMLGFPFKILQQTDLNYFVADYPLEKLEKAVYEFEEINPAIAKIVMEALSTGALTHQWTACCRISNGLLGIDLISPPSEDTKTIGLKIAGAFNQAYIRFLDLQKAEAQAREAKIALAVERVRARALAMFKSEEIIKVVAKLKDEVMSLDIPDVIAATIFLNQGDDQVRMWDLSSVEKVNDGFQLPFDITFKLKKSDPLLYVKRIWENPEDYFVEKQEEKDFERYVEWLRENNKVEVAGKIEAYIKQTDLKLLNHVVKKLKNGKIAIDLLNPPSAEMESILTKMGAAFDLAYTRFLDLQKAEAQTREAQIEVALEKVRSASMAMHKSDDLLLVIKAVHEQITELGIKVDASNVQTYIENSRDFYIWPITTTHSYQQKLRIAYIDFGMTKKMWDAWEKGDSFVELQAEADEMHCWWKKAFEVSELSHTPQHRREIILSAPGWNSIVARGKTCGLQLHRYNLERFTEQEKDILERLATVFEQSYTRFLDLQKAEAQAREAIKQASLDRVRGEIASMRSAADLELITPLIFRELTILGVPFIRCGVFIIQEKEEIIEAYLSSPDGNSLGALRLPFQASELTSQSVEAWRKGLVYRQH